jgi:hypothetical protein
MNPAPEFSKQFVHSLINNAKEYRSHRPELWKIPDVFDDIKSGRDIFYNALCFEAHTALHNQLADVSEPLLACVDLDTSNPGIVTKYVSDSELTVMYQNGIEKEFNNVFELKLFSSPLPFDRHINALSNCQPNEFIESVLLSGKEKKCTVVELKEICRKHKLKVGGLKQEIIDRLKANYCFPKVTLYHGPPGTGKTYTTLKLLETMLSVLPESHRFFICAPSNVGTINMYTRARDCGIKATLVMRDDKIPDGTYITDDERESWNSKRARVVFSTVSGRCGRTLRKEEFHTIIVDEAAQCQEAWAWGLFRNEVINVIMAGDPHQLPAQVSDLGKTYGHGISLMERLMTIGADSILLNTQRRMHPHIVEFPNNTFYKGQLLTEFKAEDHDIKPYEIVDINSSEERRGTSFVNEIEAKVVISLANKLKQTFKDTIIISPYKGQCELLKKLDSSLIIHTVDSFQGKEADVIILTTVRNGKSVGFWQDPRRLNVALTRAKQVLRIVGSVPTWKQSNTVMSELALHATKQNYIKTLTPSELIQLNIDLKLCDVNSFIQTSMWSKPMIDSRALNAAKQDSTLEHCLAKVIVKLCSGSKHKTNSVLTSTSIGNVTVDWCVIIEEKTQQLKLKFFHVRYSGTHTTTVSDIVKELQKSGPEWLEICKYENGPTVLKELPFKGRRPPPVIKEVPRDRMKEKMNAQRMVQSFRR